jgi:hypothetical protein
MAKSAKEKKKPITIKEEQLIDKEHDEDATTQQFSIDIGTDETFVLMPELEELVKKNPNRLIGCGG